MIYFFSYMYLETVLNLLHAWCKGLVPRANLMSMSMLNV